MNTPTTPQSSAPAELVKHPPEVIEAAKIVTSIEVRPLGGEILTEAENSAVQLLAPINPRGIRQVSWAKMQASEVLRDALACAEADLKDVKEQLWLVRGAFEDYHALTDNEKLVAERQRAEKAEAQVERLLTPTPKTDALRESLRGKSDRDFAIKLIAHANQQERELAEARKLLSETADSLESDVESERYEAHKKIVQFFDAARAAGKGQS